jgi:FlaA1/EpsC-like NDP-sugar epimerase
VQERWSGDGRVQVALLDVCDEDALETCLRDNEIQDAVHTAAHKHVPLVEASPAEGIRNNVFGTKSALGACALAGVERFVFLSTDKAVEPVGVMGATKRLAEELVLASSMQTAVLRCCNVLDSKGSVTETFRRRLIEGRPLELTHVQASRWFTSMDDICTWLVQMLALADDGSVFIPQVHEQVRIEDLARSIEQDLGLDPAVLKITGLRAGERITEYALTTGSTKPTAVDGLLRVQEPQLPKFDMQTLASVCSGAPPQQVREMVLKMGRGSIALESQEC